MMRFPQYTLKHAAASVYRPPVKRNFLRRLYQYLKLFTYPRGRSSHIRRFLGRIHGSYRRVLLSENDYYRLLAMLTVERKKSAPNRPGEPIFAICFERWIFGPFGWFRAM